jgi:P pilus assembly chaperone PapD
MQSRIFSVASLLFFSVFVSAQAHIISLAFESTRQSNQTPLHVVLHTLTKTEQEAQLQAPSAYMPPIGALSAPLPTSTFHTQPGNRLATTARESSQS